MRRRDFIRGITTVSAAWPLAGRAQHPGMPVMGLLHSASPEPYAPQMSVFRQSLKEAGYVEGQNVTIEFRWAENQIARLPTLAAELVHRQVSVIVAGGSPVAALAAKSATTTIPIVFMNAADPVGIGNHASTFFLFNDLRCFLANWFSGLPIPVPEMIFAPALSASLIRLASSM
jgi:putative ABC transport system substrate-binding protein